MIITRTDIPTGYQMVQSSHAVADFATNFPVEFKKWKLDSNSIISLGIKNEIELLKLFNKFKDKTKTVLFREPDIGDQATSICLMGYPEIRKKLRHLPLLGKNELDVSSVHLKMHETMQTDTQSVMEHGISVVKYYKDLIKILNGDKSFYNIRIPQHLLDNSEFILNNLFEKTISERYQFYHDIGKPYCIEYIDGKKHFPDHANKSFEIYNTVFKNEKDSDVISKLILHDMDFHLLKPSGVELYLNETTLSTHELITLLLTTLAELNSNANLFGGIDSVNFKIKYKNYEKISKKIIECLNK